MTISKIEDIHSILVKDLGVERNIIRRRVGITGTNYKPLDYEYQIKEALEKMCELINSRENVFEKGLLALVLVSYIQPFSDGNKRTASDVNGKLIDSNNDGILGDDYILEFTTSEMDIFAPNIIYSDPSFDMENVDVGSVVTVVFNEEIENSSIGNGRLELLSQSNPIDFRATVTMSWDGKSILTVQPQEMFDPATAYTLIIPGELADTSGNSSGSDVELSFTTSDKVYTEVKMIDNFSNPGDWQQPSYSGSTSGIIESGTHFDFTTKMYLPAAATKKVARLTYQWAESGTFRIREYLKGGAPQSVYFDTSHVLQSYIYGDGSNNQFRFCIDENTNGSWGDHEVSKWITINWHGWKLVEWQLNDPESVGTWIGNENLTGDYYRVDSYQMTKSVDGLSSGVVYFDNLQAVKKAVDLTGTERIDNNLPAKFALSQNYPNPFNPSTTIKFTIPRSSHVKLTVYNILGQKIKMLADKFYNAGKYSINFSGMDLTSGVYFYELRAGENVLRKKMTLIK